MPRARKANGSLLGHSTKRRCRFCRGLFSPNPSRPTQRFCSDFHRKEFWKHGGFAAEKIVTRVEREVRQAFAEHWEAEWPRIEEQIRRTVVRILKPKTPHLKREN